MELFYCNPENIYGPTITLDNFESTHICKTLRKKIGDKVDITDGMGKHISGEILSLKPVVKIAVITIEDTKKHPRDISLGIGFIRPNRLEFVLEKGTELGTSAFHIYRSTYANYFSANDGKFEKILRQAIKQSNRFYLPKIYLHERFNVFLDKTTHIANKIVALEPASPSMTSVLSEIEMDSVILLTIGPEGGFSATETAQLKENHFKDVSLGDYRLRAETAAIAGLSKLCF